MPTYATFCRSMYVLVSYELKEELSGKSKVEIEVMDLCDVNNCKKLYQKHKDVDLLINNAGFGDYGEFAYTDLDKDINMISTNVVALHALTKLYLKEMISCQMNY